MLVSVVYVNYKTSRMTLESIRSVFEHTRSVDYEIFVVDNNSEDDIAEQLSGLENVRLIKLSENLGFGRANNCALSSCTGKYVLFLNTDTVLLNDAIGIMVQVLENEQFVGQVGANLYTVDGRPNQSFMYTHSLKSEVVSELPNFLKKRYYALDKWFNASDRIIDVGYVSGAATMLRRDWLEKNGGFDPDFFMYYEDMELSVRVRKSGFRVVNVPQAKICHFGGGSSEGSKRSSQVENGGGNRASGKDNNVADAFVRRHKMLAKAKYTYYKKVYGHGYAKAVHRTIQFLYLIYATFAPKTKRRLYKELMKNDKVGFRENFAK